MYARVREEQADHVFDQEWIEAKTANAANYNAVRLRVDTLKWRAAKLKPRVYGDRPPDVNVTTNVGVVLTEDKARELQEKLKRLRSAAHNAQGIPSQGCRPRGTIA